MGNKIVTFHVTGGYDCREVLKDAGGKWDAAAREWILTEEQLDAARARIDGWRASTAKAKRAAVRAWDGISARRVELVAAAAETDPAELARDADLRALAARVRREGLTGARDADVLECVRRGYLTESAAMNTDD